MKKSSLTQSSLIFSAVFALVFALSGFIIGFIVDSQMILFDGMYSLISFALSLMSVFALRFKNKAKPKRYPFGASNIEAIVIIFKFSIILILVIASMVHAINTIIHGGNSPDFGVGVLYAFVSTIVCVAISMLLKKVAQNKQSALVLAEANQWVFDSVTSLTVFLSFLVAQAMIHFDFFSYFVGYIDPLLVALLGLYLMRTPIASIKKQIHYLLEAAPNEKVMKRLNSIVKDIEKKYRMKESFVRATAGNGSLFLEIDFVVSDSQDQFSISQQDLIREEIFNSIKQLSHDNWITVAFTSDRKWAI